MHVNGMDKQQFLEAFVATTEKMVQTARDKNNDYTATDDPFDNFFAVEQLNVCEAEIGLLVRMTDKFKRVVALIKGKEQMVKEESIDDTLIDLANYAILLRLTRQQKKLLLLPPPLEGKFRPIGNPIAG